MSKKTLIDSIEVKNACSENWNAMRGSDTVRFCGHCDLNVNNISALTRKQAMKLVRQSDGRICVRYIKNPVDNKPLFADKLYQISRRAGIAAGVLGASLALSAITYAQTEPNLTNNENQVEISQKKESDKPPTDGAAASFSGTITDQNGAVIPNATVMIINLKTNESRTAKTNDEGVYRFENILAGRYKVQASFFGFKESSVEMNVFDGEQTGANLAMEIEGNLVMGDIAIVVYRTGLAQAVSNDNIEQVNDLIAKGENVNQKDENYSNITPLFVAVENGNAKIAATLLNFGAKINAKDENKQTPLMRLDEDAAPELVNLLLKHGAKVNLTDNEGNNALMFAARSANAEVLRVLINRTSNINAQNKIGRTALMEAADAGNLENVRALLESGANVNIKNSDGETALNLANDEEIENLLTSYGATVKEN